VVYALEHVSIFSICYGQKSKSDKPQKCPGKTRNADNPWAKCHISAFDRANLAMTNQCHARGDVGRYIPYGLFFFFFSLKRLPPPYQIPAHASFRRNRILTFIVILQLLLLRIYISLSIRRGPDEKQLCVVQCRKKRVCRVCRTHGPQGLHIFGRPPSPSLK
jgi:hypothetical protein